MIDSHRTHRLGQFFQFPIIFIAFDVIIKSGFTLATCSTLVLSIRLMPFVALFNTLFLATNFGTAIGLWPNFTKAPTYVGCNTAMRLGF